MLPVEKEAHEVRQGDRLDLPPQPSQGVAVDAGQQAPLAPLLRGGIRGESAPEYEALGLQRRQGGLGFGKGHVQGLGQALGGDRT